MTDSSLVDNKQQEEERACTSSSNLQLVDSPKMLVKSSSLLQIFTPDLKKRISQEFGVKVQSPHKGTNIIFLRGAKYKMHCAQNRLLELVYSPDKHPSKTAIQISRASMEHFTARVSHSDSDMKLTSLFGRRGDLAIVVEHNTALTVFGSSESVVLEACGKIDKILEDIKEDLLDCQLRFEIKWKPVFCRTFKEEINFNFKVTVKVKLEKYFVTLSFSGEKAMIEQAKNYVSDLIEDLELNADMSMLTLTKPQQPVQEYFNNEPHNIFTNELRTLIFQAFGFKVHISFPVQKRESTNTIVLNGDPIEMNFAKNHIVMNNIQDLNSLTIKDLKLRVSSFHDGKKVNQIGNKHKVTSVICGDVLTVVGKWNGVEKTCREVEASFSYLEEEVGQFIAADASFKSLIDHNFINKICQNNSDVKIKFVNSPMTGYSLRGREHNVVAAQEFLLDFISEIRQMDPGNRNQESVSFLYFNLDVILKFILNLKIKPPFKEIRLLVLFLKNSINIENVIYVLIECKEEQAWEKSIE